MGTMEGKEDNLPYYERMAFLIFSTSREMLGLHLKKPMIFRD
jgi:hypothetical protein